MAANPALLQQLIAQQRQQYLARARQQGLLVQGQAVQPKLEPTTTTTASNGHTSSVLSSNVTTASAAVPGQTGLASTGMVQNFALGTAMGLPVMTCTAQQLVAVAPGNAFALQQPGALYGLVAQTGQEAPPTATPTTAASIARTQQQSVQTLNASD